MSKLVGGELHVAVLDETAIATLAERDLLGVSPRDAQGWPIRGGPPGGPSISDPSGILVATKLADTTACQFRLALAPRRTAQATTLVVTWNQVEQRVPVARS